MGWYEEMEQAEQEYESKLEDEALEYNKGYEQGRADERAKVLNEILEMDTHECNEEMCNMMNSELSCASCYAYKLLEQLKEQSR